MPLVFEPRLDGYRIARDTSHGEMVASVRCKAFAGYTPTTPMTDEEFKASAAVVGIDAALAERTARASGAGPAIYNPLPLNDCEIHSASGPLKVGDIEEILIFLRSLQPAE